MGGGLCGSSRGGANLLGLANFCVTLSKLQPNRLGQIGVETHTLLELEREKKNDVGDCGGDRERQGEVGKVGKVLAVAAG